MQTILGSGGAIGTPLAKELKQYTDRIRLVSRKPIQVNGDDELFPADLVNAGDVHRAVAGSEVVYLTVGLPYNIKVWQRDWPIIMSNVINACLQHDCRLVFLDNVYMYSKDEIPHMRETATIAPPSKKGKVRATLQEMLLTAVHNRGLKALIARSADFYGPDNRNSPLSISVVDEYNKGKKAFWQINASKVHSFTYTPDAAKGTAILGNTMDAYGQVWHLPTSHEKLTGRDFIEKIAAAMNRPPKYYIFTRFMMGLLGVFVPILRELGEMSYQYDRDYYFDSSKFDKRFNYTSATYDEGIRMITRGN
jgi:nucleoside-diphosphate-sugar epimerase